MNESICDNQSIGIIVEHEDKILLLQRAKFPFGLACPAGHVDEHGSLEETAINEVFEETGIKISVESLIKVIDNRRINNVCRRINGDHHDWTVFTATTESAVINASEDETEGAFWATKDQLNQTAQRSLGAQFQPDSPTNEYFEPIWLDFLVELEIVN